MVSLEYQEEPLAAAHASEAGESGTVTRARLAGERDGLSERPPAAVLLLVLGK